MPKVIGLLRLRNEELILQDTLDEMSKYCKTVFVFDDASEDGSADIYNNHPIVNSSLITRQWNSDQTWVQGKQRSDLFEYAKFRYPNEMFLYQDADERIDFDWGSWDVKMPVIMNLWDARMVEEDQEPYESGKLFNFRKYFDPEPREIPFIFSAKAKYIGVACERYPQFNDDNVLYDGYCQHYGKALSKKHWQDTCDYYAKNLPVYAEKWEARKKETGVVPKEGLLTWEECKNLK